MWRDRTKGNLDLLLLSVLKARPMHGYEVIVALRESSAGAFDMPEGTVYPSLHRLEREGLLASTWDDSGGRRRRVYRLTAPGVAALTAERRAWRQFVGGVNAVLGAST
jgi:PadR family transcriptional regulator, regulatory protein PadR